MKFELIFIIWVFSEVNLWWSVNRFDASIQLQLELDCITIISGVWKENTVSFRDSLFTCNLYVMCFLIWIRGNEIDSALGLMLISSSFHFSLGVSVSTGYLCLYFISSLSEFSFITLILNLVLYVFGYIWHTSIIYILYF